VAIVGAGIIGLAVARELLARHPRLSVSVLEREREIAAHQTGHNSGVVHAGLYYAPGSLKAQLCVEGARELRDYCLARDIPFEQRGKLVIATAAAELPRLDELERRARANAVPGLRRVGPEEIAELEPHARGLAALFSPASAVTDFAQIARAYAHEIVEAGATISTGCAVADVTPTGRGLRLAHAHGATEAGHAIFCAGAWSDRLAVAAGARADPRIVPFRGAYLRIVPSRRHLVRSLIYPVPDPSLPFLGIHLSRHVDGEVSIGPTALIAPARDAYRLRGARRRDVLDTLAWPGTWRLMSRSWRPGMRELRLAASRATLLRAGARYVPDLRAADVEPWFAGVRAQALGRDGRLIEDFAFSLTERALHVRNAPSPAATSSLAIARHVVTTAERALSLG
jgi:L-2-hydroxyglutarate oxidase